MAKAKKPEAATEEPGDIFTHLGVEGPEKEKDVKTADGPTTAELLAKVEALTTQMSVLERTNTALMASPVRAADAAPAPKPVAVDLSGLPDPAEDPKKYNEALNDRLGKAINESIAAVSAAASARQSAASAESGRLEVLWSDFQGKYPQYADHEDMVGYAAERVVKKAQARGIDPTRYMFTDQFQADVAKEVDKTFGKVLALEADEADEGGDKPKPKAKPDADEEEDGLGRTDGLFGGQESGGTPAGTGKPKAGDMIVDLQALQRKSGFF